jgi:hypothetical protein
MRIQALGEVPQGLKEAIAMITTEDQIHDLTLFLAAAPRHCWLIDSDTLAQIRARLTGTDHGRRSPDPLVATVAHLRAEIAATLEARRQLSARPAPAPAPAPAPPTPGGTRVPRPPAPPRPLPPVGLRPAAVLDAL